VNGSHVRSARTSLNRWLLAERPEPPPCGPASEAGSRRAPWWARVLACVGVPTSHVSKTLHARAECGRCDPPDELRSNLKRAFAAVGVVMCTVVASGTL